MKCWRTVTSWAFSPLVATLNFEVAMGQANATSSHGSSCSSMASSLGNATAVVRWSPTSDRLYLEGGGCATFTQIYLSRYQKYGFTGPLYPYSEENNTLVEGITGTWYLNSSFYVTQGSKLVVKGTSTGGDCDRLLLASNSDKYINLRMHGGSAWFEATHVQSWDLNKYGGLGGVDDKDGDGRSYISAISEVIINPEEKCLGKALNDMGEARLDILDSEIDHLGWYDSESYGIAYKVRGYCKDHSNPEIFDLVSVTGDILRSHIHHNYFGHYSYGHQGGDFSFNEVHDNVGYGFDPHDDSDNLTIHNNHVYNNGWHGIIASKRCDHVSIQNNVVHDNGKNGMMLHRSCDYATVTNNTAYDNLDAGLAVYESSNLVISHNRFYHNKYGVRFSMGSSDSVAYSNQIVINGEGEKYAVFMYRGEDEPDVQGSDGRPRRNHIYNNELIADENTVKIMDSDDNIIEGNIIIGIRSRFSNSIDNLWRDNTVSDVYQYRLEGNACFNPDSDIITPPGEDSYICLDG